MNAAEKDYQDLIKDIPDVTPGKMFTVLCIKTPNGKAAAMFWQDHIVVKLNEEDRAEALMLKGAQLFDPMKGRPMKEWVQIPFSSNDKWKKYLLISAEGVAALKRKATKKKDC